jgi:excisionase family DNA binding protein
MKTIFTTVEVARICKVAPRTVAKWFDSGRLRGYRIPGSQDRRIPREHLIRFLKEHGMPLGELEGESLIKVLLVLSDVHTRQSLESAGNGEFKIMIAASGFEAGLQIESIVPDGVVVDCCTGIDVAVKVAESMRAAISSDCSIIAFSDAEAAPTECTKPPFKAVVQKRDNVTNLAEMIRNLYRSSSSYRG